MQNLKLTELIFSFDQNEMKRFGDFIRSPFFNKNKKLVTAFEFFEKASNMKNPDLLSKEGLWRHVSPGENFSDMSFRSLISDLKILVEKFIIFVEEEKHTIHRKIRLLNSLSRRNLNRNFPKTLKEIESLLKNDFTRNNNFHLNKTYLEKTIIYNGGRNVEVNLDDHFHRLSDSIDLFFISSKLELMNSLLSRKYHVLGSKKPGMSFSNEIISFVEKDAAEIRKQSPFIYTEYLIYKMMTSEESDKFYSDLHDFVIKNLGKYDQKSLEQVYYPMINFGFNKIAIGEIAYLNKLFDIYRSFEKEGFYSSMERFQDMDFISIVITGLHLRKISWVEYFVDKYKSKLDGDGNVDTLNLINALICFNKKDYTSAKEHLSEVKYQNSYYYLKSKEILMQIYFENEEFESLESLIDSTRHYLNRRRAVLSIHYDRYVMFLKYMGMLLKSVYGDNSKLVILKRELKKNRNVIARDWLLEKANAAR